MNKYTIEGTLEKIYFPKEYTEKKNIFMILLINSNNIKYKVKGYGLFYPEIDDKIIAVGTYFTDDYNDGVENSNIKIMLPEQENKRLIRLYNIYKNNISKIILNNILKASKDIWINLKNKDIEKYIKLDNNTLNLLYNIFDAYEKSRFFNQDYLNFLDFLENNNIKLHINQIENIYNTYEKSNIAILAIKNNLLSLLEIESIGIDTLKKIAISLNYTKEELLELILVSYLYFSSNGNSCIKEYKLIEQLVKDDYDINLITLSLEKLKNDNKIITFNQHIYYKEYYDYECFIAEFLMKINSTELVYKSKHSINNDLAHTFFETFNNHQINAVNNIFNNNVSIITGAAGTGKSHILSNIAKYLNINDDIKCLFLTPTGKASDRLNKFFENKYRSFTVHKFIYYEEDKKPIIEFDEILNTNNIKIFFIDEMSMVDLKTFYLFLKKISTLTNIIIVLLGDTNQLPSVSLGDVFNQLIKSNCFSITKLIEIKRNNNKEGLMNAQKNILNNLLPEKNDSSFEWIQKNPTKDILLSVLQNQNIFPLILTSTNKQIDDNEIDIRKIYNPNTLSYYLDKINEKMDITNLIELINKHSLIINNSILHSIKKIKKKMDYDILLEKYPEIIILDINEYEENKIIYKLSIYHDKCNKLIETIGLILNELALNDVFEDEIYNIKRILNDTHYIEIKKKKYYLNDYIIITKNDYDNDLVNGMIGKIIDITTESIIVDFNNNKKTIKKDYFINLNLAYLITIHKSQGSEDSTVIVLLNDSCMNTRNLLYTAVTRAKCKCILIANKYTIMNALKQNCKRNSNISIFCKRIIKNIL